MPDDRAGAEAQRLALVAQTPTKVHIVPRRPESGIEAAHGFKRILPESRVTARYVLRFRVGDKDVNRTARSPGDALCDHPVARVFDIRTADPDVGSAEEG